MIIPVLCLLQVRNEAEEPLWPRGSTGRQAAGRALVRTPGRLAASISSMSVHVLGGFVGHCFIFSK